MNDLSMEKMPAFATEFARMQLGMQMGQEPDLAKVDSMADDLLEAERSWSTMLTRMRLTEDFQSREYFKMTAAWAKRQGESLESIGIMMKWQAESMKAMAANQMPPMPPPGLDLEKMMQQQQQQQQGGGGGMGSMMGQLSAAEGVSASPFEPEMVFESDVVKEEYEKLCRDHDAIIRMGERYGTYDPLGKIAFLDALGGVEDRWDVFFSRFALMGQLNPEFVSQTNAFLESLGMSTEEYREVLDEAHELMRSDAEAERAKAP